MGATSPRLMKVALPKKSRPRSPRGADGWKDERIGPLFFSRPLHGLNILRLLFPAVNCWATIIRPLCGLINLLLGQADERGNKLPHSKAHCYTAHRSLPTAH